jgi:hypothetical protein
MLMEITYGSLTQNLATLPFKKYRNYATKKKWCNGREWKRRERKKKTRCNGRKKRKENTPQHSDYMLCHV